MGTRKVLGLIGAPGAGKSSLSRELVEHYGATAIDADAIWHKILADGLATDPLVDTFGDRILMPDGSINRKALGDIVFTSPKALKRLNAIADPYLSQGIVSAMLRASGLIVVDCARLHEIRLEGGRGTLASRCGRTVYVDAPFHLRVERVAGRGWTPLDLARRDDALGDADKRRARCNDIIQNVGDVAKVARGLARLIGKT